MTENSTVTDKTAFYALLAKYSARPSQGGEEWANNNWFNLENVIDRIYSLQHESKFKLGKDKTILCSVLGACLTAAIETRSERRNEERTIIDSLQNLVQILQKQLDQERNENHLLRDENNLLKAALREEWDENSKHADSPKGTQEKEAIYINPMYSPKDPILMKNCGEHCCSNLKPVIKIEYDYISDAPPEQPSPQVLGSVPEQTSPQVLNNAPNQSPAQALGVEPKQFTWAGLSQGSEHSPTSAHHTLAQELEKIPKPDNTAVYQYIDDILVGGDEIKVVGDTQQKIISHLENPDLQISSEKIQKPSQEVKFLGIWWKGSMTCIPPDILTSLDQIKLPESRKDIQQDLELLVFWRKHITVTIETPPPDGVAQRSSVGKWYAQIKHYCNIFLVIERAVKNLAIQETESLANSHDKPALVSKVATPFSPEQSANSCFTDASAKREGKVGKYRAVALPTSAGEQIFTEGEGSSQTGETVVWSVFQLEVQNISLVYIYTDSYAVFKGGTEWLPFQQQNDWEVNRIPVHATHWIVPSF